MPSDGVIEIRVVARLGNRQVCLSKNHSRLSYSSLPSLALIFPRLAHSSLSQFALPFKHTVLCCWNLTKHTQFGLYCVNYSRRRHCCRARQKWFKLAVNQDGLLVR